MTPFQCKNRNVTFMRMKELKTNPVITRKVTADVI